MGREASCYCRWGDETGTCKVLLESGELLLRGAIRRRTAVSALTDVSVQADQLTFHVAQERVVLSLGAVVAERWAKAIATPPPGLAKKLGISGASRVVVLGNVDDEELKAAVLEAGSVGSGNCDLALLCVQTPAELHDALAECPSGVPLWVIYPKGQGQGIGEAMVLQTLRGRGFTDTKVASVSGRLTGLRFVRRG